MAGAAAKTNAWTPPAGVWVFVCIAAGLLLGRAAGDVASCWWFTAAGVAALAAWPLRGNACRCALVVAAIALGAGWWAHRIVDAPSRTLASALHADRELMLSVEGVVVDNPEVGAAARGRLASFLKLPAITRFSLDADQVVGQDETSRPCGGTLYVRVGEAMAGLRAGDRVRVTGLARAISPPRNPGEPDARLWAAQEDGAGWLNVPSAALVIRLGPSESIWERARCRVLAWRGAARARSAELLGGSMDDAHDNSAAESPARHEREKTDSGKALLGALLLGERGEALRDVQTAFTRLGLAHVIAISGMNLSILAWAALLALRATGDRGWIEPAAVALVVGLYLFVVPAQTPVIRAGAMTLAFLGAEALGRRYDRLGLLAWIAVGVLVWRPLELWSPGFQLSFGIVAALLALTRRVAERWFGARPDSDTMTWRGRAAWSFKEALAASVLAWAVASPCIAYHFGVFSPLAVPATLVLGPPITLILGVGYLALLGAAVLPTIGAIAGPALEWVSGLVARIAFVADGLPGTVVYVPRVSALWAVGTTMVIVWWLWNGAFSGGIMTPRHDRRVIAGFFASVAIVGVWLVVQGRDDGLRAQVALRIDTLDVGDGTCHIVRAAARDGGRSEAMLWDCGAGSLSFGERMLPQAARALGLWRGPFRDAAPTVVITHPNLDHYSALLDAVEPMGVKRVLVSAASVEQAEDQPHGPLAHVFAELKKKGVEVRVIAAGESFMLGGARVEFLSPLPNSHWKRDNNASLVARFTVPVAATPAPGDSHPRPERRLLLCGDIEGDAMTEMEKGGVDLAADVLEAPHHGSAKPAAYKFVALVDPGVVIQSTGPQRVNDERWSKVRRGRRWRTTAVDGAVSVEFLLDGSIVDKGLRESRGK